MADTGLLWNAPNINYAWAGLIVEELVRNGVTCFVIAPGSRSSPLTVAAARHPEAETVVHFDERGLSFYALGYAAGKRKAAALICSSGTAAANFFPAVIETSKKKLPMILLTADRPPELRHTGAMQTIDQVKLYGNYVRWQVDLPVPDKNIKPEMVLTTVDQAVFMATSPMPGPVHLNCMFREPLSPEQTGFDAASYFNSIQRWLNRGNVYTRYTDSSKNNLPVFATNNGIPEIINNTANGIIVVGKLASEEEQRAVVKLAEKLNWPVLPDIVSGLRVGKAGQSSHIIHYFDQVFLSRRYEMNFSIDTVLHLGGRITSKGWYQFIQRQKPKNYITVLPHSLRNDPFHMVTHRVKAAVGNFAGSLLPLVEAGNGGEHLHFLQQASQKVHVVTDEFLTSSAAPGISEIAVARTLSRMIKPGTGFFLSNSMPVREMDMYAVPDSQPEFIGANRGASGIDGIIATACGMTQAGKCRTTLLVGDLAFLHDLNSLALVKHLNQPVIIVVLNNDGGGIFSFLPIADSWSVDDIFEPYFGTPHGLAFSEAAAMFGLSYAFPGSMEAFEKIYAEANVSQNSYLIEVKTDRQENRQLHMQLQEKIAIDLDKMLK